MIQFVLLKGGLSIAFFSCMGKILFQLSLKLILLYIPLPVMLPVCAWAQSCKEILLDSSLSARKLANELPPAELVLELERKPYSTVLVEIGPKKIKLGGRAFVQKLSSSWSVLIITDSQGRFNIVDTKIGGFTGFIIPESHRSEFALIQHKYPILWVDNEYIQREVSSFNSLVSQRTNPVELKADIENVKDIIRYGRKSNFSLAMAKLYGAIGGVGLLPYAYTLYARAHGADGWFIQHNSNFTHGLVLMGVFDSLVSFVAPKHRNISLLATLALCTAGNWLTELSVARPDWDDFYSGIAGVATYFIISKAIDIRRARLDKKLEKSQTQDDSVIYLDLGVSKPK